MPFFIDYMINSAWLFLWVHPYPEYNDMIIPVPDIPYIMYMYLPAFLL